MRRTWVIRVVAFVVALNAIQLIYFLPHSFQTSDKHTYSPPAPQQFGRPLPIPLDGKPWPVLPSFRPWVGDPNLATQSCEAHFGNGFTKRFKVLQSARVSVAERLDQSAGSERGRDFDLKSKLPKRKPEGWRRAVGFNLLNTEEVNSDGYSFHSDIEHVLTSSDERTGKNSHAVSRHRAVEHGNPQQNSVRQLKQSSRDLAEVLDAREATQTRETFQCFYSETLRTSICEGNHMVMHPERIKMSRGGEPLDVVIGRKEEEELPSYLKGAMEVKVNKGSIEAGREVFNRELLDQLMPKGQIEQHTMHNLLGLLRTVSSDQVHCTEKIVEPTLLITRFEYANLFHTVTDWYSAYITSRMLGLSQRPKVVFLDGHCQSPMDDGWEALFSNIRYAKNFTGPVCFEHAIFTPLGYEMALFKSLSSGLPCRGCSAAELEQKFDHGKTARLREFGEMFKMAFGVNETRNHGEELKVLFIRREDYLAHPRHRGKPETRLSNERELFDSLKSWAQGQSQTLSGRPKKGLKVDIISGVFAHMPMKEQVQAVQDASVIIGAHGAGLTHIIFARPNTVVIELTSPLFSRPHYSHISQWMGLEYHPVSMAGTTVNCTEVLQLLTAILKRV